MNKIFIYLLLIFIGYLLIKDIYQSIAISIAALILFEIINNCNNYFAFREWAIFLYSINYLVAPTIIYNLPEGAVLYGMKIASDHYFELAIPGFLFLVLGMYSFRTNIFNTKFKKINISSTFNTRFLYVVVFLGTILNWLSYAINEDMGFVFYLLALLRFVAAFAIYSANPKNLLLVIVVLSIELAKALLVGMYHDALMWIVFFFLFYTYSRKPNLQTKFILFSALVVLVLFVQAIKSNYREEVWQGKETASLETVFKVGTKQSDAKSLGGTNNLLSTLNRGNQAWIFASTVDNMNKIQDFQGLGNVYRYLEAAILPRFLAPNKIKSGDKDIFNKFSGHNINDNTSMGLGIFADGYIAFGVLGVYTFGFALGLIFAFTFKLVERWTRVSPFYVLLLLPLLNYAVRPDCELQTTINHLFKGVFLYGSIVYFTRSRFKIDVQVNHRNFSLFKETKF